MVLVYAICKCNPAIWDFRSKKEFNELMKQDQGGHTYFEINEEYFKYQRAQVCAMCESPLKITGPIYTKKSLLEWAKHQIGKELKEKHN